jgi:uncharacterized protein YecE (DUF72 family)
MTKLLLGTSSWTAKGWDQVFYPEGMKSSDYIGHYATKFPTVEIDATFYSIPSQAAINNWNAKTPEDFIFSAKTPQSITHEKFLHKSEKEMTQFLNVISQLDKRLGVILIQFPYFSKKMGVTKDEFLKRLSDFIPQLPHGDFRFAVECRNKAWIKKELLELLGEHKVCCTLIDHPWMSDVDELFDTPNILTGDFLYIRWLGDRRKIEMAMKAKSRTLIWKDNLYDKKEPLTKWGKRISEMLNKNIEVLGYVNNHYSGYAPSDVETLERILSNGVTDAAGG